ncbi:hypothetical protein KKE06_03645 [Candidatus Micrarchaeota archaeon]|nr:hypothetical protein [Candidatus Micrarchaeota archaeon]MBU1930787.1 hypothetical protein [Candidatus Micrarchaeota archaeon]
MADIISELALGLSDSFRNLGLETVRVLPGLIGALIVIIVGIALGLILKRLVVHIVRGTKLDNWLKEQKLHAAIGHRKIGDLLGSFTKWYVIALFLAQAVELINMMFLRNFMYFIIDLINKGIAGVLLLVVGLLVARYVRHVIEATQYHYNKTIAVIAEVLIVYASIVMALQTIGINATILIDAFRIGFTVLVFAIAIIAGIIFALAFKKDIVNAVSDIKKEFNK